MGSHNRQSRRISASFRMTLALRGGVELHEGSVLHAVSTRPASQTLRCRERCGVCCIAPSISSPIPGMPAGKPAGLRCVHLDEQYRCRLFGHPDRPAVCASLQPSLSMCGASRQDALSYLTDLERQTAPGRLATECSVAMNALTAAD